MDIEEIATDKLHPEEFIKHKIEEIINLTGKNIAVNALSGGVDSAAVTMLMILLAKARKKTGRKCLMLSLKLLIKSNPNSVFSIAVRS